MLAPVGNHLNSVPAEWGEVWDWEDGGVSLPGAAPCALAHGTSSPHGVDWDNTRALQGRIARGPRTRLPEE